MISCTRILEKIDKGIGLDWQDLVSLLGTRNPEIIKELALRARKLVDDELSSRGKVWAAIGLDYKPCPMDCSFCSLAQKWNKINEEAELSDQEILSIARTYVQSGVDWLVIRTTEFYDFERLISKVRLIKENIEGDYILAVNTGDNNSKRVDELKSAGVEMVYHAVRLREGTDTRFDKDTRIATAKAIVYSGMILSQYLEPIGPEHTNQEIADSILEILENKAGVIGMMTRVPVEGTPKYAYGGISEDRIGHIMSVLRLASAGRRLDMIIHPYSEIGLKNGANALVVDIGAVPRSGEMTDKEWDGIDVDMAKSLLSKQGLIVV